MKVQNVTTPPPGPADQIDALDHKNEAEQLKELSQEFEAMFLDIMLKSMRNSIQKGGLIEKGNGEEIFQSLLDNEYAKLMSKDQMTMISTSIQSELGGLVEATSKVRELQGQSAYGIIDVTPSSSQ